MAWCPTGKRLAYAVNNNEVRICGLSSYLSLDAEANDSGPLDALTPILSDEQVIGLHRGLGEKLAGFPGAPILDFSRAHEGMQLYASWIFNGRRSWDR